MHRTLSTIVLTSVLTTSLPAAEKATPIDPLRLNAATLRNLERNAAKQAEQMKNASVYHDFRFFEEREKSGIDFEHVAVEDAAKHWKPAHYDHGSALATADVDQDGQLDLYFANQIGQNELWRATGGGKYENITETAGVALEEKVSVGASFADVNNDGMPDLFVTTANMGNHLFLNRGKGKFEDATRGSGLELTAHSSGAVFFDFNRDGLLDLFVCNVGNYSLPEQGPGGFYRANSEAFTLHLNTEKSEQSVLYQNLGNGKFKDVSEETGLKHRGWSGDASFCDLNEDGYPDLYVLSMQGDDRYYENQRGRKFVERTAEWFPKTPWGAMGLKFFDFNLDGKFDLYVTDMHSDMTEGQTSAGKREYSPQFEKRKSEAWCSTEWTDEFLQGAANNVFGNAFYISGGEGKLREVSDRIGAETYWPWGVTIADLNADGYEDAFVTAGMGYPFRYSINSVLLNEGGARFRDSEYVLGVEPRKDNRIEKEYFQLDCSGADKDHAHCYHKKGLVAVIGSISSRSSVAIDVDDDGDLDLVTNDMHDHPMVLVSNLAEKKRIQFLKIRLEGGPSNKEGLGSVVRLHAQGKIYSRYHDGKSGYLGQSSAPLYFGLGENAQVDKVEVIWPSGKKSSIADDLKINSLMTITEPGS